MFVPLVGMVSEKIVVCNHFNEVKELRFGRCRQGVTDFDRGQHGFAVFTCFNAIPAFIPFVFDV